MAVSAPSLKQKIAQQGDIIIPFEPVLTIRAMRGRVKDRLVAGQAINTDI
jgi:hypothetical protein